MLPCRVLYEYDTVYCTQHAAELKLIFQDNKIELFTEWPMVSIQARVYPTMHSLATTQGFSIVTNYRSLIWIQAYMLVTQLRHEEPVPKHNSMVSWHER
jgi:hypothetical protein